MEHLGRRLAVAMLVASMSGETLAAGHKSFESGWQVEAASQGINYQDGGVETFDTANRRNLTAAYSQYHYGLNTWELSDPQMVVVHSTAIPTYSGTKATFAGERLPSARADIAGVDANVVNVSAHFVIDRDGTIYQMAPLDFMCRHAIGYNHTAFGIENVSTPKLLMTDEQIRSNAWLLAQLIEEFDTLKYVVSHSGYAQGPQASLIKAVSDPQYIPANRPKQDPYGQDFQKIMSYFSDAYAELVARIK